MTEHRFRFHIFLILLATGIFQTVASAQPLIEQASGTVKIVIISDLNESYGSTNYGPHVKLAMQYIVASKPDMVICAGDMIAGQSRKLTEKSLREMWQVFDSQILKPLEQLRIPLAFTLGNHDGASSSNFAHERRIAAEFWNNNRPQLNYADTTNFPHYFSFEFAGVFVASIDASASIISKQQQAWLTRELNSTKAQMARIQMVIGHLPMYPITQGRDAPGNVISDADSFHRLLENLGVDYYISGHHHGFYLSRKGGLIMLSAGALGGGPRKLINSDAKPVKTITTLFLEPKGREFSIKTRDVTNGMREIDPANLPASLPGFNGTSKLFNPGKTPAKSSR